MSEKGGAEVRSFFPERFAISTFQIFVSLSDRLERHLGQG
ncbi:hypothetical protein FOQG_09557 [Fusarium oxysporum f. sp. raphani 54005]|uniref:Uncharacterized protein n=4 Tax=Fusarium oxysporum TaxID=5507 RepID=X0CWA2_FUSOX|nr:hypothetical protein FOVG_00822 [Fusarium oxysporum f. sp. pisi HDV247]EXK86737.1 hypothetical protein FOQG_09557 [Fusarium oxysporum f. sp. raphani 54005]EXL86991.1 hypothetical protein FOPG_01875 [Fusarium oxysporum f. sp. conglutinans race 2 54008]EXM27769.1 hypothetical protein FOTG_06120 [Fusarium oxysporum f. sp. vasinfectum 25433]